MRHIKIPGLLVALLVATSFCTYAQDQKAAIQQKLESQYALTKPTADRTDIVTAGAILVLNKDNLMMVDATSSGNPYQNTYKDGKITHNALGKFAGFANRLPGGAAAGQPGATRTFVAGEKMWVTKIDVRDNAVIFELFTDAFGNTRYKASLTFPFKGAVPPPDAVALTPQVKDMIAAEVQRQIALENSEAQAAAQSAQPDPASSGIQRMMTDGVQHVFVAGSDIDVVDASGAECAVSEGDALQLTGPPAGGATSATLLMLSSKGGQECRRGATVSVAVADLQDMQNHMRETIDQGMGDLKAKQSQGGLPAIPAAANAAPTKAAFAADAPPPDPNAGTEITQQAQDADKAEQEVLSQTSQSSGGPSAAGGSAAPAPVAAPAAPPATVSLGQTIDQITAMLGAPKSIVNLGAKKIYVYPDMKITFTAGKVTDVK